MTTPKTLAEFVKWAKVRRSQEYDRLRSVSCTLDVWTEIAEFAAGLAEQPDTTAEVEQLRAEVERLTRERDKAQGDLIGCSTLEAFVTAECERDQAIRERDAALSDQPDTTAEVEQLRAEVERLKGELKEVRSDKYLGEASLVTQLEMRENDAKSALSELDQMTSERDAAFAELARLRSPESTDEFPDLWVNLYPTGPLYAYRSEADATKHSGINVLHIAVPYVPQSRIAESVRQALAAAVEKTVAWWGESIEPTTANGLRRAILGTEKPEVKP